MKILSIFLFSISLAVSAEWGLTHEATLEASSKRLIPELKTHTVMVGRLGLLDIHPAVILSENGDLLGPLLTPIDEEDEAPYLLYLPDGSRQPLETIAENVNRGVVHLRISADSLPEKIVPAERAIEDTLTKSHWFLLPVTAPIPHLGEPLAFARDHAFPRPEAGALTFSLSRASYPSGTPIFDLAGRLIAIQTKLKKSTAGRAYTIPRLVEDIPSLAEVLRNPTERNLPILPRNSALPEKEEGDDKKEEFSPLEEARDEFNATLLHSQNAPYVLVLNDGKAITHSIGGVIVRADGMIITKASELGPSLSVRHGSTTYPAVLLNTDEATDLALLGIAAPLKDLPVIQWHKTELKPGASLISPLLLQETDGEMSTRTAALTGSCSHLLSGKSPTLHSTSGSSGLGLVTEQAQNKLLVAALQKDSPAEQSDLKPGDELLSLDGAEITTRASLSKLLDALTVGTEITLVISRKNELKEVKIKLTRPHFRPPPTGIDPMADLTLIPSIRRFGFSEVIIHTMPLDSWDCGTPLYTIDGSEKGAIGLNISANSLYRSQALPPSVIKAALKRLLSDSRTF